MLAMCRVGHPAFRLARSILRNSATKMSIGDPAASNIIARACGATSSPTPDSNPFSSVNTAMSEPLSGIYTPNITPTTPSGEIAEDELRRYIDWLISNGVHGLYPNGSTGEFVRFTAAERRRVIEIVVDQTAGRVPILAGAAEANIVETVKACDAYGEMGVRAVAVVAPFYYPLSDEGVYAYFAEIAKQVSVDLTLYNIPAFSSPITVRNVERLAAEFPRIVGIKDSSGDLPNMMRMISAIRPKRPDFFFFTGWDASLVPMLLIGCNGGTNATSGIVPELTRAMFEACQTGEEQLAIDLQYQLLPLFDALISVGEFPEGFRRAAEVRGFDFGKSRQPLSIQQQSESNAVKQRIDQLLRNMADHGVITENFS
jgi:4-hydroxy-tetrahydrodipicolinate synthase